MAARFGFSCQRCPALQAPRIPRGARVAPGGHIALALARWIFLLLFFLMLGKVKMTEEHLV